MDGRMLGVAAKATKLSGVCGSRDCWFALHNMTVWGMVSALATCDTAKDTHSTAGCECHEREADTENRRSRSHVETWSTMS